MATTEQIKILTEELRGLIGDEKLQAAIPGRPHFTSALIALRSCCDALIRQLGMEGIQIASRVWVEGMEVENPVPNESES
jgi:hypothetical protein